MRRISRLLAAISALISPKINAQTLPYAPTSILLSTTAPDLAYVFLPPSSSSSQTRLASLNISSSIQSSNLSLEILTSDLPFLDGQSADQRIAYVPSISSSGFLGVYTGQCRNSSSFWIFTPSNDSAAQNVGAGNWRQMSVSLSSSVSAVAHSGANFLASSFSFSTLVDSNDTQQIVYTFGGMCPASVTSNSTTAQSSASYSNNMLKLSYSSPTSYGLSLSSSTGNIPIAEAGFTLTALAPTFSNFSDGTSTQAQNLVLLGGHTSTAFINMSQVALFSLPQESWSFHSIDSFPSNGNTELAVKSTTSIISAPDSRSGHTTVLSTDGSSMIVFGGWVGDISQAAQPQLAILRVGSGFGGTGNWAWEIPISIGTGLSAGEGIYGHGAILLPGNVMMILGGYRIPAPSSSKLRKKTDTSDEALFLNVTSMTWISSYTNPAYFPSGSGTLGSSTTSTSTSNAKQVGLGAGLGLGLAAVIGAICVYFWYSRRLNRRIQTREKDIQELSRGAADYYAIQGPQVGTDHVQRGGWWSMYQSGGSSQQEHLLQSPASASNLGNRSMGVTSENERGSRVNSQNGSYAGYDEQTLRLMLPRTNSNRAGVTIARKPVNARNARGYYQPPTGSGSNQSYSSYDFVTGHTRANSLGTAGLIHPIYEADEDLDSHNTNIPAPENNTNAVTVQDFGRPETDPFLDPHPSAHMQTLASDPGSRPGTGYGERNTPTPESSARERELEIQRWVADWAAADALMHSRAQSLVYAGRVSPTKESASGRTESSLSERSMTNTIGLSRNGSRTESTRHNSFTAFFSGTSGNWNPFVAVGTTSAGLGSIVERRSGTTSAMSDHASIHGHAHNGPNPPPSSSSTTSSSYATANTSQSISVIRAEGQSLLPYPQEETYLGSPSKRKATTLALRRQRSGWLGSLKRVFISGEEHSSLASGSARSSPTRGFRSPSLSNSPTRPDYGSLALASDSLAPRRAVSATATMWRRKQGREDWQDSADPSEPRRANTLTLDGAGSWRSRLGDLQGGGNGHQFGVPAVQNDETNVDDEEWDIERAVERRVVQVMFTVPKERLRVVNQDVVDESSESESMKLVQTEDDVAGETLLAIPAEREREVAQVNQAGFGSRTGSPVSSKGKGRVQEMVEKLEGWRE